jgi:dolichyl-phosphate-mannose--protein O-mannosyl transferase
MCFALAPALHFALWMFALSGTGQPHDVSALRGVVTGLFAHHVEMGKLTNVLASPWYTWLLAYHPIVVKYTDYGATMRYASSMGNPVFFLLVTLAATLVPLLFALAQVSRRVRGWWLSLFGEGFARPALLVVLGYFALLSPWMVGRGKYTFWYHYLPSYGFGLVLMAAALDRIGRRRPDVLLLVVSLACVAFVFFAPVWAEFPISEKHANLRLIFQPWRP